jgi:hypothetical protein
MRQIKASLWQLASESRIDLQLDKILAVLLPGSPE